MVYSSMVYPTCLQLKIPDIFPCWRGEFYKEYMLEIFSAGYKGLYFVISSCCCSHKIFFYTLGSNLSVSPPDGKINPPPNPPSNPDSSNSSELLLLLFPEDELLLFPSKALNSPHWICSYCAKM